MKKANISIPEITVSPTTERRIGSETPNKAAGWSGWGGQRSRKGYEIGVLLNIGKKTVSIKNLNILVKRQSFEKSLFRLHIRNVENSVIKDELLAENIIFSIKNEMGWITANLDNYNINVSGKIAVSIEWLDVFENHPEREIKINKQNTDAYILFKNSKKSQGIYRWGTEAQWITKSDIGPCMNITVRE